MKKIIEQFIEGLKIENVEYSNLGGFGWKDEVRQDKKEVVKLSEEALQSQKEEFIKMIETKKEELFNSPNFTEDEEWGYVVLVRLQEKINNENT